MKRYVVTVVACLLVATVAFSLGVGVKPVELPPPIGLVGESGARPGEGAGEPRTRASGAAAQRGVRVRGDRRRSRPRSAAPARGRHRGRQNARRPRAAAGAAADDGADRDEAAAGAEADDRPEGDESVAGAEADDRAHGDESVAGAQADDGAGGREAAHEPSDDLEDDADTDDHQAERDDVADDPDD